MNRTCAEEEQHRRHHVTTVSWMHSAWREDHCRERVAHNMMPACCSHMGHESSCCRWKAHCAASACVTDSASWSLNATESTFGNTHVAASTSKYKRRVSLDQHAGVDLLEHACHQTENTCTFLSAARISTIPCSKLYAIKHAQGSTSQNQLTQIA